jgi:hypothetical protein
MEGWAHSGCNQTSVYNVEIAIVVLQSEIQIVNFAPNEGVVYLKQEILCHILPAIRGHIPGRQVS